jgi:hypothetical protein
MPINRDIAIQYLARIPARHARRQTGDRRFAEQLDGNSRPHETRQAQRLIGRERAMPKAPHDMVRWSRIWIEVFGHECLEFTRQSENKQSEN